MNIQNGVTSTSFNHPVFYSTIIGLILSGLIVYGAYAIASWISGGAK